MTTFIIEDYLNELSQFVECIDISHKGITYLPDLSKFTNLKKLNCSYNKLTNLPKLGLNLKILCCHHNLLTVLPPLPENLEKIFCYTNKLTSLPPLNINLVELWCSYNELTSLPSLNINLEGLFCSYNKLTSFPNLNSKLRKCCYHVNPIFDVIYNSDISILKYNIETLNRFKNLFYCLKYKKQFRYLLWFKLREPKIQKQYHPNNLTKLMIDVNDDTDLFNLLIDW